MATSALYQSIELLSQEKGIDPAIVVGAVEEAIALATRKYLQDPGKHARRAEQGDRRDYRLHLQDGCGGRGRDRGSGQPDHADRSQRACSRRRSGQRDPHVSRHQSAGPHRRAARQADHLPEGPRSRTRHRLPGIRAPRERSAERHRQAHRRPGRHLRPGQGRGPLPQARAVATGAVHRGRARARGSAQGGPRRQGTAGDRQPRRAGAGAEPVSVRGSGDLRQHRRDQGHRARGRRAHQDRRAEAATRTWTRWAPAWA